ncbi:MAG: alpha/beta hydrolase-fold protein [Ferruginibacter sp.]
MLSHRFLLRSFFSLLLLCSGIAAIAAPVADSSKPLVIGQVRKFHSAILNEERTLNIYLPYDFDSSKTYPVLYLLDGSMDEDFIHITGLAQFFNLMFTMPECIIVGIANVDRKRDFTFQSDLPEMKKTIPTGGHSDAFIRFVENELQPYIEKSFPVNATRYLIGQSLGGLVAAEILLKKPELFTHYFIISPSLWWDKESLLKAAPALLKQHTNVEKFVYISAGKKEPPVMPKDARQLYNLLNASGLSKMKLHLNLMAEEDHGTILHRSIYEAFLLLFKPRY